MKYTNSLLILVIFSLLPIAGCIQGQATVSLNSDGSGRVEIEAVIDPCGNAKQENIWQSYRNYLAQIKETLLESEGISAWDEVEWKVLPNGKYYFKGLAFFESINDVAIHLGKFNANLRTFYIADANGNKVL